jgi:hypothetical protein
VSALLLALAVSFYGKYLGGTHELLIRSSSGC